MADTTVTGRYKVEGNHIVSVDNASWRIPWNPKFAEAHGLPGAQPVQSTGMRFRLIEKNRRRPGQP